MSEMNSVWLERGLEPEKDVLPVSVDHSICGGLNDVWEANSYTTDNSIA
jgi:hypothetical protein